MKYKLWDSQEKQWREDVAIKPDGTILFDWVGGEEYTNLEAPENSRFVVCLFTGLKDSKGVEIYVGDILEGDEYYPGNWDSPPETDYQRVIPEWDDEQARWVFADVFMGDRLDAEDLMPNIKVIGNKYEHDPQMLGMKGLDGADLVDLILPEEIKVVIPEPILSDALCPKCGYRNDSPGHGNACLGTTLD